MPAEGSDLINTGLYCLNILQQGDFIVSEHYRSDARQIFLCTIVIPSILLYLSKTLIKVHLEHLKSLMMDKIICHEVTKEIKF